MSNFSPLADYVTNMSKMLELHGEFVALLDQADIEVGAELRNELERTASEVDLEFVMEDVRSLVNDSREGLERVRDIVVNLNQFARKDSVECIPSDINDAVESTLKLLANDLKHGVTLDLQLGDLPLVPCQIGLIKQVLLNLFKNGVQAMNGSGTLSVATAVENDRCAIRIRDQGGGISEAALSRIFDPFFTTKPVGEGTGLGLSLSHGIITQHKGLLEVVETTEQGTEFLLALPLKLDNGGFQAAA